VWTYFDTSALVKRYVDEAGRREVLQLLRRNECVTSAVLPVEMRSGLRRRVAEGSLEVARLPAILKHVAADCRHQSTNDAATLSCDVDCDATHHENCDLPTAMVVDDDRSFIP
jgi:hypothetical protein